MKKTLVALVLAAMLSVICLPALTVQGAEVEVSASAAVLMEGSSGEVLFAKNEHEIRPCASITKVMTLCLVFDAIEAGQLSLTDTLSASAHAASMGGSDIWLKEGETMTVDDLLKATVIMSANDAAVVLAEHVAGSEPAFVTRMNEKAQALGMGDTVFKNCNGLDEEGHVTSAYDVALMSRELLRHEGIRNYTLTWIDSVREGQTQLVNTNKLVRTYPGITGLKTGTTSQAGSCITASAQREEMELISVILGAPSTDDRFRDAAALLDYGFAGWTISVPETPVLEAVKVAGGMEEQVQVEAGASPRLLLPAGDQGKVEQKIVFSGEISAPVEKGDVLGAVHYVKEGETLAQVDIIAKESVEKIIFSNAFSYLLQHFFSL